MAMLTFVMYRPVLQLADMEEYVHNGNPGKQS